MQPKSQANMRALFSMCSVSIVFAQELLPSYKRTKRMNGGDFSIKDERGRTHMWATDSFTDKGLWALMMTGPQTDATHRRRYISPCESQVIIYGKYFYI